MSLLNLIPKSTNKKMTLILLVTASIIIISLPWGVAKNANVTTQPLPALAVTITQVQSIHLPLVVAVNGNIAAWQEAIIGTETNGLRLKNVFVNVGDIVKKGQLLATFADETIAAELAQAKASLAEAQASVNEANNNLARARTLQNTGALSNQQIDQYTTAAEIANARVEVAKTSVNLQEIRLKNTKIYAPDHGSISARNATEGAVMAAGSDIFHLIRQSRLEWRAEVIPSDLPKIKMGMLANITTADGANIKGKVRKISPMADANTRNTIVFVDLQDSQSTRAGMFAKGEFVLGKTSAIAVPLQALVLQDGFHYVFTVKNQHAQKIKVITGRRFGGLVEIINGLTAQQAIIASGGEFLSDNDFVKVVTPLTK